MSLFFFVFGLFQKEDLCLNLARLVNLAFEGYSSKCHMIDDIIENNLPLLCIL